MFFSYIVNLRDYVVVLVEYERLVITAQSVPASIKIDDQERIA